MSDPTSSGEEEFLTLTIGGNGSQPERLLLIGRPRDGLVRVRAWDTNTWNTEGDDFDIDPADLLADIERSYSARLKLSEEIYRIRRWLGIDG